MGMFPIQIISTGEERVVERLGKYNRTLSAGLNFIIPVIETTKRCNIKQNIIDTPSQQMITSDNVSVDVNAVIFYKVEDTYKAIYKIQNFREAISYSAMTNLRNLVGSMPLDKLLSDRDKINNSLLETLDKITDEYGVKIISIEIQDIKLSKEIEEAMNLEKSSALNKKAAILKAEGERQAAIEKSNALKESLILEAEGNKQKLLLDAQAEAEYKEKLAQAEAISMKKILDVFEGDIEKYLQLKQLEGIVDMSKGDSNKLIIPSELLNSLGKIDTVVGTIKNDK